MLIVSTAPDTQPEPDPRDLLAAEVQKLRDLQRAVAAQQRKVDDLLVVINPERTPL